MTLFNTSKLTPSRTPPPQTTMRVFRGHNYQIVHIIIHTYSHRLLSFQAFPPVFFTPISVTFDASFPCHLRSAILLAVCYCTIHNGLCKWWGTAGVNQFKVRSKDSQITIFTNDNRSVVWWNIGQWLCMMVYPHPGVPQLNTQLLIHLSGILHQQPINTHRIMNYEKPTIQTVCGTKPQQEHFCDKAGGRHTLMVPPVKTFNYSKNNWSVYSLQHQCYWSYKYSLLWNGCMHTPWFPRNTCAVCVPCVCVCVCVRISVGQRVI